MEEKFKALAHHLEVPPSDELWNRFQKQRSQTSKRNLWLSIAASLFFALTMTFFYSQTTYQLQPLETSKEIQGIPIVSLANYPTIEEGSGKIRVATPID